MATGLLVFLGVILIVISGFIFKSKFQLYKKGVRTMAKVVELQTYSYVTPGPEYGLIYHTGYTPIMEVLEGEKKILISYHCEGDLRTYSEGDEVEVIYPKGNIEELEVYTKYGLYKLPSIVCTFGVLLIIVACLLLLL
ncbi:MAG: hypothetical protein RR620_05505 [Clostridium sp.]